MKHIIWLPFIFSFFSGCILSAQNVTKVVLVSKGGFENTPLVFLPSSDSFLEDISVPQLPIRKVPDSFAKKYLVRVYQSDERIDNQFLPDIPAGVIRNRGTDHKGYDYFLPLKFDKKDQAEWFLTQLKGNVYHQAVVVKKLPRYVKCNCSSRF